MDCTSDAVVIDSNRCQLIANLLFDAAGRLRASVRLVDVLPQMMNAPIDGVAWYYQQTATNTSSVLPPPFNSDLLIFASDGTLYYSIPSASPLTTRFGDPVPIGALNLENQFFPGAFFQGRRVRTVTFESEMIVLQEFGVQPQRFFAVWPYGVHLWQCGINNPPTPTAADAGAGVLTGTYTYKQTFYDERGRESSPSEVTAACTVTITTEQITVTIAWGDHPTRGIDRQIKGAYVYRNTDGGTVWYRVADIPIAGKNTTLPHIVGIGEWLLNLAAANDNSPDADISTQPIAPNPGEYDPPNPASIGCIHKNRLILNDVTDVNAIQISVTNNPTQFTSIPTAPIIATDGIEIDVDNDQGDPVVGLISFGSVLGIFKRRGVYYLDGDNNTNWLLRPVYRRGCIAPDSVVRCDNIICFLSDDGVYAAAYQGGETVNKISKEVEKLLLSYSTALREQAIGWFVSNAYYLAVGPTIFVFSFDVSPPGWGTLTFGNGTYELGLPDVPPIVINAPGMGGGPDGTITAPGGDPPPDSSTTGPISATPGSPDQGPGGPQVPDDSTSTGPPSPSAP